MLGSWFLPIRHIKVLSRRITFFIAPLMLSTGSLLAGYFYVQIMMLGVQSLRMLCTQSAVWNDDELKSGDDVRSLAKEHRHKKRQSSLIQSFPKQCPS